LVRAELVAAQALSEPQKQRFGLGALPALALDRSLGPSALVELRLRGGALVGKTPSEAGRLKVNYGGLGSLLLGLRLRPFASAADASRATGMWLDVAAGAGVTGELVRATGEAGLGWSFKTGGVALGPLVRYLHILQSGSGLQGADGKILLFGLELVFLDPRPAPPPPPPLVQAPPPPPPPPPPPSDTDGDGIVDRDDRCPDQPEDRDQFEDEDGCPDLDNDKDGIADAQDKCPNQAEVVNGVEDEDGCPDEGLIQLVDDRVVLEENVLFDSERARVKVAGHKVLEAVVRLWKQHPEWERLDVEGHSDARGRLKYNQWLSEERAKRVRAALVGLGVPEGKIAARGLGATRPRDEGKTPEAFQRNRRVELVVTRKVAPAGGAPVAPPKTDAEGPK
jgi:outer membrane protein OmpA-like peptidoglycan-associated protein